MSILKNVIRNGNFTSSQAYRIAAGGKVAQTYIDERNMEREMGRSLSLDAGSQATAWGDFMEIVVFKKLVYELMELEYILVSDETSQHETIPFWVGSPDMKIPGKLISEIKGYQPKNWYQFTKALMTGNIELIKANHPQEYWQAVSNAIIEKTPEAEMISFMPYLADLPVVIDLVDNYDGEDQWKYSFISNGTEETLPWLPDGGRFKDLTRFRFEPPVNDRVHLVTAMMEAGRSLINQTPEELAITGGRLPDQIKVLKNTVKKSLAPAVNPLLQNLKPE